MRKKKTDDNLPTDERKLRDDLEQDKSLVQVNCGIPLMIDSDPGYLKARNENNRIKLSLYKAALSGKGIVKAKKSCSTDEGGTIVYYLIVEQGKIKIVADYSRDPFGGLRVLSNTCKKLVLGSYDSVKGNSSGTFQEITGQNVAKVKKKVTFSLQCEVENDINYRKTLPF